jgi:hypothetical protein
VANTSLPTGDHPPGEGFFWWRRFSQELPIFDAGQVAQMMTTPNLPSDVVAAYAARFPEERYAAGARQFPLLVPTAPDDPASVPNRAAWSVLRQWQKPLLTAFSDLDPAFGGAAARRTPSKFLSYEWSQSRVGQSARRAFSLVYAPEATTITSSARTRSLHSQPHSPPP